MHFTAVQAKGMACVNFWFGVEIIEITLFIRNVIGKMI